MTSYYNELWYSDVSDQMCGPNDMYNDIAFGSTFSSETTFTSSCLWYPPIDDSCDFDIPLSKTNYSFDYVTDKPFIADMQFEEFDMSSPYPETLDSSTGIPVAKRRKEECTEPEEDLSNNFEIDEHSKKMSMASEDSVLSEYSETELDGSDSDDEWTEVSDDTRDSKKKIRVVESKEVLKCSHCLLHFDDGAKYARHIKTHCSERPHRCTICDKSFTHSSTLKDHMNIHLRHKPYVCTHPGCDKSFTNGSNLNRHLRVHTGEKPYKCNLCKREFSQSSNLKVHLKIHKRTKNL